MSDIKLEDLEGEHVLSGVDIGVHSRGRFEHSNVVLFVLDGKTYEVAEDPDDGYRSYLGYVRETVEPVKNVFAPHRVVCLMRENGRCEILDIIDDTTGKVVLSLGTDDTDDYYPFFVAEWMPENLSINAKEEK